MAHLLLEQGVASSNLAAPTNKIRYLATTKDPQESGCGTQAELGIGLDRPRRACPPSAAAATRAVLIPKPCCPSCAPWGLGAPMNPLAQVLNPLSALAHHAAVGPAASRPPSCLAWWSGRNFSTDIRGGGALHLAQGGEEGLRVTAGVLPPCGC